MARPHPVSYIVTLFFGYLAGMNSGGSWWSFVGMAACFLLFLGGMKIIKIFWNMM